MPYSLPDDYTFGPGGEVLHEAAFGSLDSDLTTATWDDDTDVIRESLSPIDEVNDAIKAKKPVEAWRSVNKLSVFLYILRERLSSSNDEKGMELINSTFGALVVQTLRSLDKESLLTDSDLPDLEIGLERLTRWGTFAEKSLGLKSSYLTVIKGYGKKLFGDRTEKERIKMRASRKRAYKRFLKELDKSEKESRELPNGELVDDEDEVEDPWKGASKKDAKLNHADFDAKVVFKKYLVYLNSRSERGGDKDDQGSGSDSNETSGSDSNPDSNSNSDADSDPDSDTDKGKGKGRGKGKGKGKGRSVGRGKDSNSDSEGESAPESSESDSESKSN